MNWSPLFGPPATFREHTPHLGAVVALSVHPAMMSWCFPLGEMVVWDDLESVLLQTVELIYTSPCSGIHRLRRSVGAAFSQPFKA
jgi:hypothetical protein